MILRKNPMKQNLVFLILIAIGLLLIGIAIVIFTEYIVAERVVFSFFIPAAVGILIALFASWLTNRYWFEQNKKEFYKQKLHEKKLNVFSSVWGAAVEIVELRKSLGIKKVGTELTQLLTQIEKTENSLRKLSGKVDSEEPEEARDQSRKGSSMETARILDLERRLKRNYESISDVQLTKEEIKRYIWKSAEIKKVVQQSRLFSSKDLRQNFLNLLTRLDGAFSGLEKSLDELLVIIRKELNIEEIGKDFRNMFSEEEKMGLPRG